MKLKQLLEKLPGKRVYGNENPEIRGVVYDPLRVKAGFLYVAINIYTQLDKIELPDGHPYVDDAIEAGAVAVILQQDRPVPPGVTKVIVPDSRLALAIVAAEFYEHPSRALRLIGITGTNGKTTTAHIIEGILRERYRIGLIGTLYYKINGEIYHSKDTTPEPPDLQEIFTNMKQQAIDYCVMEVSSHGIDFHRVAGLEYEVGVWTNFTQDHLDWHKTMDAYRQSKLDWFRSLDPGKRVLINVDDPAAHHFKAAARARQMTYGIENPADITARDIQLDNEGTNFTLVTPGGNISIAAKLRGRFNLYNILAAVGATLEQGVTLGDIKAGLEKEIVVAGRFQAVSKGQDFIVIVDYAHTADGLQKVLNAARSMNPERIVTVFGCGGDRDPSKRPQMAAVVEQLSEEAIITDDNPRTEDPVRITDQIVAGFKDPQHYDYRIIHDRYQAIDYAIRNARPGNLILIAGKGHETTQTLKDTTLHFNDVEVAGKILEDVVRK